MFARGARRLGIFWDEEDYLTFIGILKKTLDVTGCCLWAYALMSNHYHFVIEATTEELTRCMRRVNYLYSKYHNRRHELSGHTFDGPYKAYAQGTDFLTLWRIAYVFLNPVVAGIVTRPENYPWSSYRSYLGLPGDPLGLNPLPSLLLLDNDVDRAREKFRTIMARQAAMPPRTHPGVSTAVQVQSEQFAWIRDRAHEFRERYSDINPDHVALLWGKRSGVSPRAMALCLETSTPRQVSNHISCLERRTRSDPKLANALVMPT